MNADRSVSFSISCMKCKKLFRVRGMPTLEDERDRIYVVVELEGLTPEVQP